MMRSIDLDVSKLDAVSTALMHQFEYLETALIESYIAVYECTLDDITKQLKSNVSIAVKLDDEQLQTFDPIPFTLVSELGQDAVNLRAAEYSLCYGLRSIVQGKPEDAIYQLFMVTSIITGLQTRRAFGLPSIKTN